MDSEFAIRPFFRNTLFLACLAAFCPAAALAQDRGKADPSDAKPIKQMEAVTVAGSHLSDPNLTSPLPLITLTADDIKASGATNIGDVLARLPQFAANTMGNSGGLSAPGIVKADMRGLGTDRTLTLINGRRSVGSSAGETSIDLNLIPVDWIERVEIITGSGSAIYGADAIGGVTNFILKKNYRGVNLHAQLNTSQHGGFRKNLLSLTGGTSFAKDRGNLAVSIEQSDQGSMEFADRFGSRSYAEILTPNGPTDKALFANGGDYSFTSGGTFSLGDDTDISKRYVFDPDGSVRRQRFNGPYDINLNCANCDYWGTNRETQLQPSDKRTTLSAVLDFNITPLQHLYAEGSYSHVDAASLGQIAHENWRTGYVIASDNAFMTPALAKLMTDNHLESIQVSRKNLDAGRSGQHADRNTKKATIGARGAIGNDWQYDASLAYGVTNETLHYLNNRINDRFYASIDAVKDASGKVVCRSTLQPASPNATTGNLLDPIALGGGCIPTGIFGDGAINPAAARWFNTTTTTTSRITQFVGSGAITNNNLFQMPFDAGAASFAAGMEFRRETSGERFDPLDIAGLTFFSGGEPFQGKYDVREGYAEATLPLLTGRKGVKSLTFDAAVRLSDYNTTGHAKIWRWGMDWALDDNLRLRGTLSGAMRAPNIQELFLGQSKANFGVDDPCSVSELKNGRDPAVRAANCRSLGVPSGWTSADSDDIDGITGSNPDLKPERGLTWTAGMVLTPQFLPDFGLTIDYWNIKLTNAITSITGRETAGYCVDSINGIDNQYCDDARRSPITHELVFIRTIQRNISLTSSSGADIDAYYTHRLFDGKLRWDVNASKLIAHTEYPFQDDPHNTTQRKGTSGSPAWKANLGATYTRGHWVLNWSARYFSSMLRVDNESYKANPRQTTPIHAGAGFFNDARVAYSFKDGLQLYAGVTKVFDRNPPVNMFGNDTGLYDAIGRAYYAGFNYKL